MCKKIVIVVAMILIATCGLNLSAQSTFHGPILYDAVGPVKEIKLQTDDPIETRKTIKFSKNGKENKSLMTYNDVGYPTGFGLQMGERESTLKIYYNTENLVDSLKLKDRHRHTPCGAPLIRLPRYI